MPDKPMSRYAEIVRRHESIRRLRALDEHNPIAGKMAHADRAYLIDLVAQMRLRLRPLAESGGSHDETCLFKRPQRGICDCGLDALLEETRA